MNIDVINCIPSKTLRIYLKSNPAQLSILQQATIISVYADDKAKPEMFRRLIAQSDSDDEKLLLKTELTDPEAACEVYREKFPHKGFPIYPFLEVCNLPVLFRPGEIIRRQAEFYYVGAVPYLPEGLCDFSDECYLCYSLRDVYNLKCRNYYELGYAHEHVGICEAERASVKRLTSWQWNAMLTVKKILAQKNGRPSFFSKARRR